MIPDIYLHIVNTVATSYLAWFVLWGCPKLVTTRMREAVEDERERIRHAAIALKHYPDAALAVELVLVKEATFSTIWSRWFKLLDDSTREPPSAKEYVFMLGVLEQLKGRSERAGDFWTNASSTKERLVAAEKMFNLSTHQEIQIGALIKTCKKAIEANEARSKE